MSHNYQVEFIVSEIIYLWYDMLVYLKTQTYSHKIEGSKSFP